MPLATLSRKAIDKFRPENPTLLFVLRLFTIIFAPLATLITTEWIHRDTLLTTTFLEYLTKFENSYLLAWVFLIFTYGAIALLTGRFNLATAVVGIVCHLSATITYYKLALRGEPFLPWDINQFMEASNVMGKANLQIRPSMIWTLVIFIILFIATTLLNVNKKAQTKKHRLYRYIAGTASLVFMASQLFFVYLQPAVTLSYGIVPDMWLQNRFYARHGVVTGFLTNLQTLHIAKPEEYSQESINKLRDSILKNQDDEPMFPESYAAVSEEKITQPNIIYIMGEAFWDVDELEGIEFDRPITPTLQYLKQHAATGRSYSPSFGGGTCDVEFEALTGFSVEHLPAGSKPYQQHITKWTSSLPNFLKDQGYDTLAIHSYYRKYWSRDRAYPNLGIDQFIAAEDFKDAERKRNHYWKSGLITDEEVGKRIIAEYEAHDKETPLFLHAVTMQNHSSYSDQNYPADELINVTKAPETLSETTIAHLRDFATGVNQTDAMLGMLIDYFKNVDEPTILVFWGDHYNTVGKGYELYEKTGYIEQGDTKSPALYSTPLVVWSNYHDEAIDLGTIASYNISPVMMELYGLEKPLQFDFLLDGLSSYRARTRGVTINPDGSFSGELTTAQQEQFNNHWLLQYDLMFGENYLLANE